MLERIKESRLVRVAQAVLRRFGQDGGNNMAAAVAYYGFLSLFPLLLLSVSIIGFVLANDPATRDEWVRALSDAVPGLGQIIGQNVEAVVDGRGAVGVIALAGLAWSGAGVVSAAGVALNRIFRVPGYESFLRQTWWRFRSLAALGGLALIAAAVTGSVAAIAAPGIVGTLLPIAAVIIGFGLDVALFMLAYRMLTQRKGPAFEHLWVGSLFAAAGWTFLKVAGSWYVAGVVTKATAVYGTFAAVVGVLVLLHLAARLLVYGAEINAVLLEEKRGGGPVGDRPNESDDVGATGDGERMTGDGDRPPEAMRSPEERSVPDLMVSIAQDSATLVRKELELARQGFTESMMAKVKSLAAMAAAGLMGIFVVGWLSAALARALDLVMPMWASRLVVAGAFLLLAGVAFLFARKGKSKPPLERTKQTIKEDVRWAKAQLRR